MKDLIGVAVLIAALCGGGGKLGAYVLRSAREAALAMASRGLPKLAPLAEGLTRERQRGQ